MKQAIILYRNEENIEAINFIQKNFEEIFGQYISFSNYYLTRLEPHTILKADAFLVRDESILQEAKAFVDDFSKMIKINRSRSPPFRQDPMCCWSTTAMRVR